jgi:cystathionine beta-lyase/cystathionine gamma-synthase
VSDRPDDVCPRPDRPLPMPTDPLVAPIYPSAVYRCDSPDQADRLLSGAEDGYVYSRDRHPNGDLLAEKVCALHGAERAVVCSSGMAATSAITLSQLTAGDHVVVGNQMYGRTLVQLAELGRLGVLHTTVDACDIGAVRAAMTDRTRLVWVETITNPLVRVVDVAALAEAAHLGGAQLVVDNTFASPALCRPLALGADFVYESLTKIMNGHSDVLLGVVCGGKSTTFGDAWKRVPSIVATYGLSASPFDCWLAARGIGTLALRAERASSNALAAAEFLAGRSECEQVYYPGLASHADHALAKRQFGGRFGSMVSFTLRGERAAADRFIAAAKQIPFCPSLGDLSTTLSHPQSTSHRGLSEADRRKLGITGGTIRLSVGIESPETIVAALAEGLATLSRKIKSE